MSRQRFPADMSTRRMRENIDPETGDPRTGPAPYRAIGTDAQVTPAFRAIGGSGGSSSLLDRRSGGLFAKGAGWHGLRRGLSAGSRRSLRH